MVIGKPEEGGVPRKYYMTGQSGRAIFESPQQTLLDASLTQTDTQTILRFRKLLQEPNERTILTDAPTNFIFAYGRSNTFGYHKARGHRTLPGLNKCQSPNATENGGAETDDLLGGNQIPAMTDQQVKTRNLWVAHGILMALSWAVFLPLGIGCSILRNLIPGRKPWFELHRALNSLAFLLMTAAFGIAVHVVNQNPGAKHFDTNLPHRSIGLAVYVLSFVQAVAGFCRPSLPQDLMLNFTHHGARNRRRSSRRSETSTRVVDKDLEANSSDDSQDIANTTAITSSHSAPAPTTPTNGRTPRPNMKRASSIAKMTGMWKSWSVPSRDVVLPDKSVQRVIFEIGHRLLGYALLGMAWYNCYTGFTGLGLYYGSEYDQSDALWGVIGGICGLTLVLFVYQSLFVKKRE